MFKKLTSLCAKDNRGFSLIELIVVIAILGVLAGVAIPQIGNAVNKARKNADISNAANIAAALSRAVVDQKINDDPDTTQNEVEFGELNSSELETVLVDNNYMQVLPKPRYESSETFKANVDEDGKITVFIGNTKVYPEPEGPYGDSEEEEEEEQNP